MNMGAAPPADTGSAAVFPRIPSGPVVLRHSRTGVLTGVLTDAPPIRGAHNVSTTEAHGVDWPPLERESIILHYVRAIKTAVHSLRPLAVGATLSVLSALLPATASATPPVGASAVVLSKQTVNGKDYIVSDITIAPGGSTGWHTHQGEIFGIVKGGT